MHLEDYDLIHIDDTVFGFSFSIAIFYCNLKEYRNFFIKLIDEMERGEIAEKKKILNYLIPYFPNVTEFSQQGRNFVNFTCRKLKKIVEAIDDCLNSQLELN